MAKEEPVNDNTAALKKKNFFRIGIIIFLVTAIISSSVVISVVLNISKPKVETKVEQNKVKPGITVPLGEEIIVNLAGSRGRRYLKINAVFEVDSEKTVEEIGLRNPQIRDLIIGILRQMTVEKISEKEGIEQVRSEIITGINNRLSEGKVTNIYFTDFVVQ